MVTRVHPFELFTQAWKFEELLSYTPGSINGWQLKRPPQCVTTANASLQSDSLEHFPSKPDHLVFLLAVDLSQHLQLFVLPPNIIISLWSLLAAICQPKPVESRNWIITSRVPHLKSLEFGWVGAPCLAMQRRGKHSKDCYFLIICVLVPQKDLISTLMGLKLKK